MTEPPAAARGGVHWRIRSSLSSATRRRVRALTDPFIGPLGSIRAARTDAPLVALTFDDGPDSEATPGVLDALARHAAQASWFVLVDRAEARPDLIQRMLRDGHDVELHGADHRRLTRLAARELRPHIAAGARRLAALTGRQPRWFRPPYGSQNLRSYVAARRCGLDVVVWSADCADWEQLPETEIAERAVRASRAGAILLLHDGLAADPETPAVAPRLDRPAIVERVLSGLAARGLRSVSLSELLRTNRPHRTAWFRP